MLDAAGMRAELETFPEGATGRVFGIVNGDAVAAVAVHHGEARDVRRAVADVDHVFKRDRALLVRHVIVHVLIVGEHAFVDAEKELGFGRVGNDAFREADAAFGVFAEFAAENRFDERLQPRAVEQRFQA